jgi:ankyrin repeat protein
MKAMTDQRAGEVICVLDALDECEESGRYEIIRALDAFYSSSEHTTSNLKFFVTSRPYFDIESRFRKLTHNVPTIRLRGEKESEAISKEIEIVIRERVKDLRIQLNLTQQEHSNLEKELLAKTHRTYLWLKLILEVIQEEFSPTTKRLKQITSALPSTVDEAYEAILSKSKDPARTRKLLHIIVAATNPLTLTEMNIALAIEDHHRSYEDLDLESESRFECTLRNICGLFVSVVDQRVYLLHQTAKEFLVAKSQEISSGWKHSLDPVDSELTIARTCIAYLTFDVFDEAIDHKSVDHGYLGYASEFWAVHYRGGQSREAMEISPSYLKLCDTQSKRFQTWFNLYWNSSHRYASRPGFTNSTLLASYFGHEFVVKLLLATGQADADSKDSNHRTPLWWAAANGHEAVVKLLIATGQVDADVKDSEYSQTPLSRAAEKGYEAVVKLLLATGQVDADAKDRKYRTPLSWATANGHEAVVKTLLATGQVDADAKDRKYRAPLSWAAANGHEAVVKLLLATGQVDADAKDWTCRTPLSWAAANGHEAVVKLLIATGQVDANARDSEYSQTPLSRAAEKGYEAVVKLLLATSQVDADAKDWKYRTPLSWAAANGYEAVVKLLLATGQVDADAKDRKYRTPLSWATVNGYEAVVKLLLATGQVDADAKESKGQTPLSRAAAKGYKAIVKLLLATGQVDADGKDSKYGRTPLWRAAENGHEAVVKLLLATGQVDADSKDIFHQTPLSMAAGKGHEAVVKLLLATGQVNVNSEDRNGQTPLSWAARNVHEAVVKLLKSHLLQ